MLMNIAQSINSVQPFRKLGKVEKDEQVVSRFA